MPNYPTSAPSFTTKNTDDTIQAAHVNDLQTEVVAIGTDLVDGTIRHDLTPSTTSTRALGSATRRWRLIHGTSGAFDRLESTSLSVAGNSTIESLTVSSAFTVSGGWNSSNSTVNALQVSSNSTLGGALQVSSNSTFAASVQISSNCTIAGGLQSSNSTCQNLQVTANSTMGRLTLSSAAPAAPSTNSIYANTVVKAWAAVSTAGTLLGNVNISSAAKASSGLYNLAFGTALASSNYCATVTANAPGGSSHDIGYVQAKASTGLQVLFASVAGTGAQNPDDAAFSLLVVGG